MSTEHERRFIVSDRTVLEGAHFVQIEQGYLWDKDGYAIRVRLSLSPDSGTTTAKFALKGPRIDAKRFEMESLLPIDVAKDLLKLSDNRISKRRYTVFDAENRWTVDEFFGANQGLLLAEFESDENAVKSLVTPDWIGEEVTELRQYDNEQLARKPINPKTE